MRQYNYFQAFYLSFFSAPLYCDVARRWRGTGFLYLLLLLALAWIPTMAGVQATIARGIDSEAHAFVSQIPAITITNGEVSTDVETPHFIRDPDTDKAWAIIDLTGEYTSLEDTEAAVLLTRRQVLMKRMRGTIEETRGFDLSTIESFSVTRADIQGWLEAAKVWLAIVFYPFAVVFSFIYRIVQALIYALIGLLIARSLEVTLDYGTLLRLAVVAVTPVIILGTVLSVGSVRVPALWLISFAVAMGYLTFAIKANAAPIGPDQPTQPTPEPIT